VRTAGGAGHIVSPRAQLVIIIIISIIIGGGGGGGGKLRLSVCRNVCLSQ